ncbi:hypothetical protein GCG54_00002970 [Colletotrichum gloeosporioides]|uniref:SET domain-containing protein n=1 Tax=Colletotrichum gloeosporioides TaxID=474922 RepID=A0A8H4CXX4_COLGL|nr:uncharacterized protein GCG54_00002970 [Colletotrichum gloeosporioides]KAF3812017.1 hypothetical protein GCG54_00002970 [Colletotrichum gloeosporioides]
MYLLKYTNILLQVILVVGPWLHNSQARPNEQCPESLNDNQTIENFCPIYPDLPEFNLHTLQHNITSEQQSTCVWSASPEEKQQFCVFADSRFNNGKGITIVTTPERAQNIFRLMASTSRQSTRVETLFRTEIGGRKGRGIFANKQIAARSIISRESPIIILDHNWFQDIPPPGKNVHSAMLALAIEQLPSVTRLVVDELYAGLGTQSQGQKMWTNGYGVVGMPPSWLGKEDEPDAGMITVHTNISKINHSCRPNAVAQWDWESLTHNLYAVRDIATDEEITISYIPGLKTSQERYEYANQYLGFNCTCSLCMAPGEFVDLSDSRVNEILLLEQALVDYRHIAPAESVAMAELLVGLYEQEGLAALIGKAYAIAALEWNGVGSEYQARLWAYRSVQAGLTSSIESGVQDYLPDMENLLDGARKHWSWRYRA